MRLVLFADLHLDATFTWAPVEIARRRRANLRQTLRNIVELAEQVDADAILSAGDLYEQATVSGATTHLLRDAFGGAGRPVVLSPGNHDPFVDSSPYATLDWPANVIIARDDRLAPLELADGFTLWTAAHRRTAGTAGFLDGFRADGAGVHYALFHGSAEHHLARESTGKQPHAPFTVDQVARSGLDHALVGHFHRPYDGDWHTYPGNPDPLTFGEDGWRGAVVIDVGEDGSPHRQRHTVAVSEVHDVTVEVTGASSVDDIQHRTLAALADLTGQVRVTLTGELMPELDLRPSDLAVPTTPDRFVVMGPARTTDAHDLDAIAQENTVRGMFARRVLADDELDDDSRRHVLTIGLRAIDGRDDLAVV